MSAPEARLIDHFGKDSVMACYYVGIYSDRVLLGKGQLHNLLPDGRLASPENFPLLVKRGFTSSLLSEKFAQRVPVSGLVPLSVASLA